ncbi:MAG: hypothetical protein JJ939_00615 [Alphaproteobacteria bacterium]|nr:hypothetical protein [Rhodobiaceae bacterium]MBO6543170.1 hypothetical protein [Alphaproteobacteria bacterium]MBO6626903.1 hypothetical protein [Alphaproteobacteria bacterium]MDF1627670.1 hypothetical protein [Parvibaculaceae bacterium]|tara:strand:+ start:256 stop:462 length:207 start_codon:yes stop_codon:yes gene_type:complete
MNIFRTYTDSLARSYGVATYQAPARTSDAVPAPAAGKTTALFNRLTSVARGLAGLKQTPQTGQHHAFS